MLLQGLVFTVHNDLVLAKADTRQVARDWMVKNIPSGKKIVVEPIAPDQWAMDAGHPIFEAQGGTGSGNRWNKWRTSRSCFFNGRTITSGSCPVVKIEDYERTTRPELVELLRGRRVLLRRDGLDPVRACVRGPEGRPVRAALLRRAQATRARSSSAPARRARNVPFSFDYSFNYYPLTYARPGPEIVIYRLDGENCAVMKRLVVLGVVCGLLAVAVPNLIVWLGGRTPVTTDTAKVPHAQAALVLGAQVYRDGRPSIMLRDRVNAAAELYRAGRVDKLLLSGDHSRLDYDEVGTMRRLLLAQGIPARGHLHRPRGLRHVGLARSAPSASSTSRARSSSPSASTWRARSTTPAAPA